MAKKYLSRANARRIMESGTRIMTKQEALEMIDKHIQTLSTPVEMFHWTVLRIILYSVTDETWLAARDHAEGIITFDREL